MASRDPERASRDPNALEPNMSKTAGGAIVCYEAAASLSIATALLLVYH